MAEDVVFAFDQRDAARIGRTVRAYEAGTGMPPPPTDAPRVRNYTRIPFRNDANETVPEYAVLRVTGMVEVDGRYVYKIAKPNTTFGRLYLVNGPNEVKYISGQTGYGWGTWLWHADYVLYDTANTPAYGESWGPQDNTWTIKRNGYGFRIQGGNTGSGAASRTIALQIPPSTVYGKPTGSKSVNATDATVDIWDRAFTGSWGQSTGADVIVRVRDVTTATRVSVDVDGSPPVAFPIDCEDS